MAPTLEALSEWAEVTVLAADQHGGYDALEGWSVDWMPLHGKGPRAANLGLLATDLACSWAGGSFPDVLLLIGDRGESLAAAFAAHQTGNIIIAHVEGGDVTGCLDDSCRHAISKLAHVHFCTGELQKNRLIRMGEAPERVHIVGDVHIDRLMRETGKPLRPLEWAKDAIIILYHPDTLHPERTMPEFREILRETKGKKRVFVYPCSDLGHEDIVEAIEETGEPAFPNIPHDEFIMGLRQAKMLVGNSSCAVKEAPYIGLETWIVGERQKGRPIGKVYGDGRAYERISSVLKTVDKGLLDKRWCE